MATEKRARALRELAEASTPDTMDLWPGIRSRAKSRASRAGTTGRRARLAAGLAVAVLLALVAAFSNLWSPPQPVSAETILAKAQAASKSGQGIASYHIQSVSHVKHGQTVEEEVWYAGGRARMVARTVDAAGSTLGSIEYVYDGTQTWVAKTANGQTIVERTAGTGAKFGAQQTSLADFLAQYNDDKSCMTARVDGEAIVAGRATYAVVVEPNPANCPAKPASSAGAKASDQASADKAVGKLRVWVDKETFVPLKTIVTSVSGSVVEESEATSVQYNVTFPDSLFTYTPPAGATVITEPSPAGGKAGG